jgi:hypothetical protein
MGGIYDYDVEMGSSAKIYIPIFIKVLSVIRMFMKEDSQTHRQSGDLISYEITMLSVCL